MRIQLICRYQKKTWNAACLHTVPILMIGMRYLIMKSRAFYILLAKIAGLYRNFELWAT